MQRNSALSIYVLSLFYSLFLIVSYFCPAERILYLFYKYLFTLDFQITQQLALVILLQNT